MTVQSYVGWAIDTHSLEGHGFIGRYWPFGGGHPVIPAALEGHHLAVFKTRALARASLGDVKNPEVKAFARATVVKVRVTVESEVE